MTLRRSIAAGSVLIVALATFSASPAAAGDPVSADNGAACPAWDVEYDLTGKLQLKDTPLGQGDGIYPIGPGRVVLRFEGPSVQMRSYAMRERFTIKSRAVFWTTTVITDSNTTATPDQCGNAADGALGGRALRWTSPVRGYRTDGTLTCDGSLCGKFGAPPPGQSQLHIGPAPVRFNPFDFAPDMHTFTMSPTPTTKTETPKQSGFVTIAGREARRTCVQVTPCASGR